MYPVLGLQVVIKAEAPIVEDNVVGYGQRKALFRRARCRYKYSRRCVIEKAFDRAHDPAKRRGLIWHTQGSGKTFTMLKTSELLFKAPESDKPTILLLIDRNELLRAELTTPEETENPASSTVISASSAPFTIYMVQHGETLFSIAMKHYGSSDMVKEIMLWNQGWIRSSDELIAGMGLVLFPLDSEQKNKQIVEQYLQETTTKIQTRAKTSME